MNSPDPVVSPEPVGGPWASVVAGLGLWRQKRYAAFLHILVAAGLMVGLFLGSLWNLMSVVSRTTLGTEGPGQAGMVLAACGYLIVASLAESDARSWAIRAKILAAREAHDGPMPQLPGGGWWGFIVPGLGSWRQRRWGTFAVVMAITGICVWWIITGVMSMLALAPYNDGDRDASSALAGVVGYLITAVLAELDVRSKAARWVD